MNDLVCIFRTFDSIQANLIKSTLENESIPCIINSNDASGTLPYLNLTQGGIEIFVHKDDANEAKEIIKSFKPED